MFSPYMGFLKERYPKAAPNDEYTYPQESLVKKLEVAIERFDSHAAVFFLEEIINSKSPVLSVGRRTEEKNTITLHLIEIEGKKFIPLFTSAKQCQIKESDQILTLRNPRNITYPFKKESCRASGIIVNPYANGFYITDKYIRQSLCW